MSTATLIRTSDNMVIPVTNMTIATDIDSWGWSFSGTVKTQAALDACKPSTAEPVQLRATINGHSWNVLIDGYNERGSFASTDFSITGRTMALELCGPMAEPRSHTYNAQMNLSQLFDNELSRVQGMYAGNWTGVWEAEDGLIPANHLSYQDKTPMEVIQMLASVVGAHVYHDTTSRTIRVEPKYKKNPWNLNIGDEDYAIHPSSVISTGMSWKPNPDKNGIFVSGTTPQGYLCKVTRNGTDGAKLIPMVTDQLIVTAGIARERGRYHLNESGKKGDYSFELLVLDPTSDLPVLKPGKVIRYYATPNWYGVIKSVSVGSQLRGDTLIVRQQVTVERHFE